LVKIRICAVSNLPSTSEESNGGYGIVGADGKAVVNSRVSGAVYAMVAAAAQDGVTLTASSGFRTMAHQQALYAADPDPTRVAVPGTSNHQMGLAIDFAGLPSTAGPIAGNQYWEWLSAKAANFGFKNYPAEAWHWSVTGN
jgi:LAS superfamily LD-carboxypeptidase LdcB